MISPITHVNSWQTYVVYVGESEEISRMIELKLSIFAVLDTTS